MHRTHLRPSVIVSLAVKIPAVKIKAETSALQLPIPRNGRVPTPHGKSWIFFLKIPGPGKSWKSTLVLESPGNWSLRKLRSWQVLEKYAWKLRIFISSNGKQAEIVNVPVCADFFNARQHICYSAYMLSSVRPSVRPSVCHTGVS